MARTREKGTTPMRWLRRRHKHRLLYHGPWNDGGAFERWHCDGCGHDFCCLPTQWAMFLPPEQRIVSEHP